MYKGHIFIISELAKSEELTVTVDIYEIQSREPYNPWPKADESVYADTVSVLLIV